MVKQFATFKLDQQLFGIDVLLVREINQQIDFTPVQHSADYIRGLINLRGRIVTILDLGVRLGLAPRKISANSHNVILKTNEELVTINHQLDHEDLTTSPDITGLLVDTIGDVVSVEESQIEPPPASIGKIGGRFLYGVLKLEKELLVLLNVKEALAIKPTEST